MAWNRSSVLTTKSVVKSKQIWSNKLITTNILAQTMNKLVSEIEMTTIRRLVFIYNKSKKILGHQNRARHWPPLSIRLWRSFMGQFRGGTKGTAATPFTPFWTFLIRPRAYCGLAEPGYVKSWHKQSWESGPPGEHFLLFSNSNVGYFNPLSN